MGERERIIHPSRKKKFYVPSLLVFTPLVSVHSSWRSCRGNENKLFDLQQISLVQMTALFIMPDLSYIPADSLLQ